MKSLASLQSWLTSAISDPGAGREEVAELISSGKGGGLPAEERLAIYGRSFYGRLLQVMQGEFPALSHALGGELFDGFVSGYLRAYPPQAYTLTELGRHFPRYLQETRPTDASELWPNFIIELAHLERTFQEVFHGEGGEKTDRILADTEEGIKGEPWTRALDCRFPVHEYFLAYRAGQEPGDELPAPIPCRIFIYRRDYRVRLFAQMEGNSRPL